MANRMRKSAGLARRLRCSCCRSRSPLVSLQRPADRTGNSGEALVRTFNELRPALIGALNLALGNFEDAQDVAQEAFLKCWRSRASIPAVRDLRAWIFRVGRNSAKDLQRNAFRRRARPLAIIL